LKRFAFVLLHSGIVWRSDGLKLVG
jgi:hypothetical protein